MNFEFTARQQHIHDVAGELGRSRFGPRAAANEAAGVSPVENFKDLFEAGLIGGGISREWGGIGGGMLGEDPLAALIVVEQAARYCVSTSQCISLHYNLSHRLEAVGTPEQKERIITGIIEQGHLLNGTASEPGRTARGLFNLQTTAEKVEGGWVINGHKNYGTLADIAHYNIVSAVIKGESVPEGHMTFMLPVGAPGFTIVAGSWNPFGMRAAYSPDLLLEDCFVADENVLGPPGETASNRWQAKAHLGFAAQYLGGCEGVFDYLVDYLPKRGTAGDSYAQLRLGEIRIAIDAARWLIYRAAWLWQKKDFAQAELFSMNAKYQSQQTLRLVIDRGAQIAGSSALEADTPLARHLRDLRYQSLHENLDKTAATVGKFHLGQTYDVTARL